MRQLSGEAFCRASCCARSSRSTPAGYVTGSTCIPATTPYTEASALARKPNYDFEKRMKESARKAKKDAKRNERLQRKSDARAEGVGEDSPGEGEDAIDDAGDESVPE